MGPDTSLPVLATWECLIGVGPLAKRFLRATLLLLALQMVGTLMPLILFPLETFTIFPFAPTLEGQYIIKNVVLIGGSDGRRRNAPRWAIDRGSPCGSGLVNSALVV